MLSIIHSRSFMNEVNIECEISSSDAVYNYPCLLLSIVCTIMDGVRFYSVCPYEILISLGWILLYLHSYYLSLVMQYGLFQAT